MAQSATDSKQQQQRLEERYNKAIKAKDAGINPYPYRFEKTHTSSLKASYAHLESGQTTQDHVRIAGRIMTMRSMGKLTFIHLQDQQGTIQVLCTKQDLAETYSHIKLLDLGDYIGVSGHIFKTKAGEVTVHADTLTILCKAVRDLPEKYHGLKDPELRYRQRHVDFIMNPDARDILTKRSLAIATLRDILTRRGFIEIETPLLQQQYGGANARPFITHINAWDMPMYLSISPELYLKRLVVGGFEKVFTICKNFRNEGVDHSHNPEFTMLEAYQAYADYTDMMELVEECYEKVALAINGTTTSSVTMRHPDGSKELVQVDFKAPWPRVTILDAIKQYTGIDAGQCDASALRKLLAEKHVSVPADASWGTCVMSVFDELVEHCIIQPTHIIDRPIESSPLCKGHRSDDRLIEQDEPICAGMEMCNSYSELNDPKRQRALLEQQSEQLRGGDDEAHPMDEQFIRVIEQGMPPTGGTGIGVDRMVMLITGQSTLREVIPFPVVKPAS